MSVYSDINALILYAMERELISPLDETYIKNQLIDILGLPGFEEAEATEKGLEEILTSLCDFAVEKGIIEDNRTERDLFDTRIMGALTPRPSEVISKFCEMYLESPECATDWYYNFSQDTDYIRRYRIARDMKWTAETEYGTLDITINLAKPEKDPRAIAAAKNAPKSGYPACALCAESEGYAGRLDFPARQNHRIVPIEINGELWKFQYSPYVYYNEHCIALNSAHVPMKIDDEVFPKLLSFIDVFPHYFIGSNADLPIVGGSILSHEHFQGGRYTFAMERAPVEKEYTVPGFEDISVGRVKWPMSVIRLDCPDYGRLTELATKILACWRGYTDEKAFIFAETEGVPHNTLNPIVRRRGENYELDLVLRNNITTEEHPLGVFHPHAKLHHIKKENIGLIEVMGLAILPGRLKTEMEDLRTAILEGRDLYEDDILVKHADWAYEIMSRHAFTEENTGTILRQEIGKVFEEVLEDAGVYKGDAEGREAFRRFIDTVNG